MFKTANCGAIRNSLEITSDAKVQYGKKGNTLPSGCRLRLGLSRGFFDEVHIFRRVGRGPSGLK